MTSFASFAALESAIATREVSLAGVSADVVAARLARREAIAGARRLARALSAVAKLQDERNHTCSMCNYRGLGVEDGMCSECSELVYGHDWWTYDEDPRTGQPWR